MEKEQLYQAIEAYLDGELDTEALATFERELTTDEVLAREVALHRRLQNQLGDGPKMDLRTTLDAIAGEFPAPDPDTNPSQGTPNGTGGAPGGEIPFWWFGLGFALIIGGILWWYLGGLSTDTPPKAETTQVETTPESANTDAATTTEATTEKATEAKDPEPADTKTEAPTQPSRPQAYDTNAQLEPLIGKEIAEFYAFTDGKLDYTVQGQRAYLNFNAKLTTAKSLEEGLFLQLYTNQYPKGRVFREAMVFKEVNPDAPIAFAAKKEYFAAYSGETKLDPALYYGVITLGNSKEPLWAGKVRVE